MLDASFESKERMYKSRRRQMKILMVFIDMLRNELVSDKYKNKSEIMNYLSAYGGTIFESCYTPAPDTYRSLGALWSSRYPKENGCDHRSKRPFKWLENPEQSLLGHILGAGYEFNSFVGAWERENVGLFPDLYKKYVYNFSTGRFLSEYVKQIQPGENSFTFVNLEDLHFILDDQAYTKKAFSNGEKKVKELLSIIFDGWGAEEFDEVILFSDHGFRFWNEYDGFSLDKRRSNIFLFWHSKGDSSIRRDKRLCSIMDIYPTLLDKCGINYEREAIIGKNLFGKGIHNSLVLEDHSQFYPTILDSVSCWGIVDSERMYFCDSNFEWSDGEAHSEFCDMLMRWGTGYDRLYRFMEREKQIFCVDKPSMGDYTSDGKYRVKKTLPLLNKICGIFTKVIKKVF